MSKDLREPEEERELLHDQGSLEPDQIVGEPGIRIDAGPGRDVPRTNVSWFNSDHWP